MRMMFLNGKSRGQTGQLNNSCINVVTSVTAKDNSRLTVNESSQDSGNVP